MSYKILYEEIQGLSPKIKTNFLKQRICDLTNVRSCTERWSGEFNPDALRGVYLRGPLGAPFNLGGNDVLIVLARKLNRCWRRFVLTKELMHMFDEPGEMANSPETFDAQLFGLDDPTLAICDQVVAERKAFWRALGALCPEKDRLALKQHLTNGTMSPYEIALTLKIPEFYVGNLMWDNFTEIMDAVKK